MKKEDRIINRCAQENYVAIILGLLTTLLSAYTFFISPSILTSLVFLAIFLTYFMFIKFLSFLYTHYYAKEHRKKSVKNTLIKLENKDKTVKVDLKKKTIEVEDKKKTDKDATNIEKKP
jgi:amino acid permease